MPVLDPLSGRAGAIDDLFWIVTIIGAIVLLLVAGLLTYFAIRYRARPGAPEPAPIFGSRRIEIAWIVIPLAIVLVLFGLSLSAARTVDRPADGRQPDLVIIGHQWWWEVIYSHSGAVTANEIHIPAGEPLLVQLESIDVIHDFWVPQLGRKLDAIPGQPNRLWIQADRPGTYLGTCAEYCGAQHAWMRLRVVAHNQSDFDAWLAQQSQPIARPTSAQATEGEQVFQERTCASCHAVAGTASKPNVGPNLAQLATRETIAAGVLANTPENLARWLKDPAAIKPESLMPDLNLTEQEIQALVAYLEGQP